MQMLRSFFIFSFAFLLIALLFEVILSCGGILMPIIRIDPNKGERYRPDKTACSVFVSEGFGLAETNSSGWFGKKFKDDGLSDVSVGVIGSSWVASRQVFYRDNFLSVAEKSANKKLQDKKISLYNFGKDDLPLKEMLYIKEEVLSTYNPDKIIILLNKGSFRDDSQRYVAFYNVVNNKFYLDTSFRQKTFVKNYSRFQLLTKSSLVFLMLRVKNHLPEAGEVLFDKFYHCLYKKPGLEEVKEVDSITLEDKAIIQELAKDKKVIFLLNLDKNIYATVKPLLGQAPIIDLQPALQKLFQEQRIDPYFWEITNERGHWNIPAHKVVGEEIATRLTELVHSYP
jgi:hypothetical protein